MSFTFRIDPSAFADDQLLFLEDANAKNSQYHAVHRDVKESQDEVRRAMARLGGAVTQFTPVIFEEPDRYGYLIEYVFRGGAFGQFPVAGLPIRARQPSETLKDKARRQALNIAADVLDASANSARHIPLSNPLLLHLLIDGKQTIAQMIAERQALPERFLLSSGS